MKKQLLCSVIFICASLCSSFAQDEGQKKSLLKAFSEEEVLKILFQDAQGPYGKFTSEQEDVSLRTENSKHFRNSDGTYSALIGAGPIHYKENGEWKTILAYILTNSTGKYTDRAFAVPHNRHKLYLPATPGLSIISQLAEGVYEDWGAPALVWLDAAGNVLAEVLPHAASSGQPDKQNIVYPEIFPGITAEIQNSVTGKKLNYIIQSRAALASRPAGAAYLAFRENIKIHPGWKFTGTGSEKHLFALKENEQALDKMLFESAFGQALVQVHQPVYYEKVSLGSCADPGFDTTRANPDGTLPGNFLIRKTTASAFTAYTLVPVSWLDVSHRKYPVTIDPVTDYYPGGTWPTHTANRPENSGSWYCYVGTYAGRTYYYDISYGWIDDSWPFSNPYMDGYASFNISAIPTNATINSATTYWYRYGGRTCGDAIILKHGRVQNNEYLANQPDCNIDGIRIRNNNGYYNSTGKNSTGWQSQSASTTDVTNALSGGQITMGWAFNGGDDCCTFICTGNDGDYHHIYGYEHSTLKPYIRIDYCVKPSISAHPSDVNLCTSGTMPALSVTAAGTALTYQWQVSNNTACSGASNWQDISGATSSSYTPPKIAGTRLYRVVVTASDCPSGLSGRSINSNCARVVVNIMNGTSNAPGGFPVPHGTGDNPPPIQFSNCGGLVLPGSSHTVGTLQPPNIGAVNNVTGYSWAASGGSFTGSGSSVTWTAPTALGTYNITVTYSTSCGSFQSTCSVQVASPNCNYAYVSPSGVDASDKGGPDNPYATLAYAVSQLGGRTHIRMATGNYTETQRVNIPNNVIIEGRYDAANGWRKQNDGSTNITFTANTNTGGPVTQADDNTCHLIGFAANGTAGWTLQDINVTTNSLVVYSAGPSPPTGTVYSNTCNSGGSCKYLLNMYDSYGDGWNGGYLTLFLNGVNSGTYAASGYGTTVTVTAGAGQSVSFTYTSGSWETENSYNIQIISRSERGASNYGLWINGASNYNIIRCQFTSGAASNGANGYSPPAATLRNNGSAGQDGHCDNNWGTRAGGAGGAAVGSGVRTGGAGGVGGQGSSESSSNNTDGTSGSNGGGGAAGATCGGAKGANGGSGTDCNRDGRAGCNGADGANGTDASTTPPAANSTFSAYWVPNGQSASGADGQGGGGGKGGGGGGRQSCTFCDDGPGGGGGGGGSGGQGGQAGTGGWGGGGSFSIYRNNSSTGANIDDVVTAIPGSTSSGGSGGVGGNGAPGGTGYCGGSSTGCNTCTGSGGCTSGSPSCGNCEVGLGGKGGNGGAGGKGGNGQPGAPGRNEHMVTVVSGSPTITNPSGTIATSPVVRVLHDKGKPCINSEINLYKASGTWTIPSGLTFVNDKNEQSGTPGTSYTTALQNIKVYTTTASATYDLTAPADFPGFLRIASDNRPLPTITIVPNSLCVGTGAQIQLTHTNPWNTQVAFEWVIFSATGNDANNPLITSTSNNPLVDVSSLATGSYKVRYRVREICCGWSRPVYATFTITPQPTQPNNLTKTSGSNYAQVCEGATSLSVNAATGSTGGAGTCGYQYAYQNTDGNWSAWQSSVPSVTAGVAPGYVRIKARYACDGTACQASPETPAVEWEIMGQPVAGSLNRLSPAEQNVCIGASLTPELTGSTGGVSPTDEIRWRIGTSGGWNTYSGAISTTTHGTGDYYFQTRRTSSGYGCTSTGWGPGVDGTHLWTVVDDPVAPTITKNPPDANVCTGAALTVNVTAFGSGGAGSCEDQMRYSTDNGFSWSAWSTTVPNITASTTGTYLMEARRYCSASGCNSNVNSVSWTVVSDPSLSNPTWSSSSICVGGSSDITSNLTGGTGTMSPVWEYYNGSSWAAVANNTPAGATYTNTASATMTISGISAAGNYQYRRRLPATGIGCDATSASATLAVVNDPVWQTNTVTPTSACVSASITLSATFTGGVGGTVSWTRATTSGGSGTTVTSPDAPPVAGTYYYRPVYNATVSGCNLADGAETTVAISQPNLTSINASVTPSMASGDYLWNGLNGSNWAAASNWYVLNGSNFQATGNAPSSSINVYIVTDATAQQCVHATNYATVSSTENAKSLYLDGGATLIISGNNALNVYGNWVSESASTFTYNTGTVLFKGNTNNTVTVNGKKFYNIDIDKNTGYKITLNDNFESVNKVTVVSGTLEVPANVTGKSKLAEIKTGAIMDIKTNGIFRVNP